MAPVTIDPAVKRLLVRMSSYEDKATVAAHIGCSVRTVDRVLKKYRDTGDVIAHPYRRGRLRTLNIREERLIVSLAEKRNDAHLDELRAELEQTYGISVSATTIWSTLSRAGLSMKQLTRRARERSDEKRRRYILKIGAHYSANQLVFVDESSVDKRTSQRKRGWARRNGRAFSRTNFQRGKRFSVLPAISLSGLLELHIVRGSFNARLFKKFIADLLAAMNDFPAPNSVIVLDNCRIHKSEVIRTMVEESGKRLVFLPPYSPDFNPIEEAFASVKAWLRRNGDVVREAFDEREDEAAIDILTQAVCSITPTKCAGWFTHCGY